jgi:hypothetical protein
MPGHHAFTTRPRNARVLPVSTTLFKDGVDHKSSFDAAHHIRRQLVMRIKWKRVQHVVGMKLFLTLKSFLLASSAVELLSFFLSFSCTHRCHVRCSSDNSISPSKKGNGRVNGCWCIGNSIMWWCTDRGAMSLQRMLSFYFVCAPSLRLSATDVLCVLAWSVVWKASRCDALRCPLRPRHRVSCDL